MKLPKVFLQNSILLTLVAGVLLLVANSALWVHSTVFNSERFTEVATESLTSESSRQAIASGITERVFEGRPVAQNIVGGTVTNVLTGLLGTEQVETVLSRTVARLHVYVTSPQQESITLDLSSVKAVAERLVTVTGGTGERLAEVPDEVLLIDKESIPNFYSYAVVFVWLGPLALIGGVALLLYQYMAFSSYRRQLLLIHGIIIITVGLFGLLLGPLFRPPLLSSIPMPNARIITGNLYDAFITMFNQQTYWLIAAGLLLSTASIIWYLYDVRKKD